MIYPMKSIIQPWKKPYKRQMSIGDEYEPYQKNIDNLWLIWRMNSTDSSIINPFKRKRVMNTFATLRYGKLTAKNVMHFCVPMCRTPEKFYKGIGDTR